MGTLAKVLADKKIPTPKEYYWADVAGDIENVNNILKITRIRVTYHMKVPKGKRAEAKDAFSSYLGKCPAAQSVIGCIDIQHHAVIKESDE